MSGPTEDDSSTRRSIRTDGTVDADVACDRLRAALREGAPEVVIGHYHLKREIASGGMGVVYEAVQENPRRVVAVKVMRTGGLGSRNWLRRFQAEAQALARLHHPCIAQIFEAGSHETASGAVPFFAMEYIPGAKPLPEYAARAGLNLRQRLELFVGVCRAVHHAHTRGIIHRDLKPANILVGADGQAKVIDFGVARAADAEQAPADLQTDMRSLVGTLMYMSPEQCEGDPNAIDARSDVYTLGVVLFELLTGRLPYAPARGMAEIARRICDEQPIRSSSIVPELAGDVESVLLKALQKEPSNRYQSAGELADDLDRLAREERVTATGQHQAPDFAARVRGIGTDSQLLAWIVASVVACVLMHFVGSAVIYRWPALHRWYMRTMVTALPPGSVNKPLEAVKLITLSDRTDFAALSGIVGADGVSQQERHSYRKLHGVLLRKLAQSGVRVVAFDLAFGPPSDFDKDFVAGIKESGLPVVVGQKAWDSPTQAGRELISPNLAPQVRRGGMTGQFTGDEPWYLDLAVQKPGADAVPSLSLVAVAAFYHPDMDLSLELREIVNKVDLRYSKLDAVTNGRTWLSRAAPVSLTVLRQEDTNSPVTSVEAGDWVGSYLVRVPRDEAMAKSTVDYVEVLKADAQTLRSWFDGKVALVGDVQQGHDAVFPYPDGRALPGCYAHATAIDAILSATPVRLAPGFFTTYSAAVGGALLSVLTVRIGRIKRLVVLGACLILVAVLAVWLYVGSDYLIEPFNIGSGIAVGFGLHSLLAGRRRQPRHSPSVAMRSNQ
jgi:tRNA A-37 threonylcarbamoyl transferase component Bud32